MNKGFSSIEVCVEVRQLKELTAEVLSDVRRCRVGGSQIAFTITVLEHRLSKPPLLVVACCHVGQKFPRSRS